MQKDECVEGVALAEGPRLVSALFVDPVDEGDGCRVDERDRDRITDRQQVVVRLLIYGEWPSPGMVGWRWRKHMRQRSRREGEKRRMRVCEVDRRCRAARWKSAEHLVVFKR